jgi:hypothetical protein
MSAIDEKHAALLSGGILNLGAPLGPEIPNGDGGALRSYQHGTILWHPEIGAFEVHGLIGQTYLQQLGGPEGRLGFPTSDEFAVGEGRMNTFELGASSLFYSPVTGVALIDDAGARGVSQFLGDTVGGTMHVSSGSNARLCFPPSVVISPLKASAFGLLAENYIRNDYCSIMGCTVPEDYFDRSGSSIEYLVFLQSHNPSFSPPKYRSFSRWKRPDILTHAATRREWYEIKPFSTDGMIDFGIKYTNITRYFSDFSLPYVPGDSYTPTPYIPIGTFPIGLIPVNASLAVSRRISGLVDYMLCLQGDLVTVLATMTLAALSAAIINLILAASAAAVVAI